MSSRSNTIKNPMHPSVKSSPSPSSHCEGRLGPGLGEEYNPILRCISEEEWNKIFDYMEANDLSSYSNRLDCVRDEDPGEFPYTLVKVKPVIVVRAQK